MWSADDGLSLRLNSSPVVPPVATTTDSRVETAFEEKSQRKRSKRRKWKPQIPLAYKGLCLVAMAAAIIVVCYMAMDRYLSPHIQTLVEEKQQFQMEISALKKQLNNISKVAETRLKLNNLLQKQIDRQTIRSAGDHPVIRTNFVSTLVYSLCCSALIVAAVSIKVYFVVQRENLNPNRRLKYTKESTTTTSNLACDQPPTPTEEEEGTDHPDDMILKEEQEQQSQPQNNTIYSLFSVPGCIV